MRATWLQAQAALESWGELIEKNLKPGQCGLWASYWSLDGGGKPLAVQVLLAAAAVGLVLLAFSSKSELS